MTSVVLKDGRRLERVCVVGGTVTSVDGSSLIPFHENEIAEFVITHDRARTRA